MKDDDNSNSQNEITDGQQKPFTNCPSSPQGRSLREFEDQMASLRKENFNLKLRIYFLEEKPVTSSSSKNSAMNSSCSNIETIESLSKKNIDLKVSDLLFTVHFR